MSFINVKKKPVVVKAKRFYSADSAVDIIDYVDNKGGRASLVCAPEGCDSKWESHYLRIDTLEGPMVAKPGSWIIEGVFGEFYSCDPDVFKASYTLENGEEIASVEHES